MEAVYDPKQMFLLNPTKPLTGSAVHSGQAMVPSSSLLGYIACELLKFKVL